MICFVSVSTFRKRIVELLKVKRGVYGGVTNEICQAFKDATIEQIRQNRDMILLNNDAAVIKLRMPEKKQHLSKADGYRLIYMVMKQSPLVAFLDVYPKRGPSQQLDIEDNETARLVMEFVTELQANLLVMHDINDNLKSIAQE